MRRSACTRCASWQSQRAVPEAPATPVRTRPLIDRQRVNVDLIPYALREDQRRLPPALTDRFALQVTPSAPFTIELPEALVTLTRYQHVEFPIVTTRVPGFDGPITFSAVVNWPPGARAARRRVRRVSRGDAENSTDPRQHSLAHPVEPGQGAHRRAGVGCPRHGRHVTLGRTFELEIRAAFTLTTEPTLVKLTAEGSAKVRLTVRAWQDVHRAGDRELYASGWPGVARDDRRAARRDERRGRGEGRRRIAAGTSPAAFN